MNVWRLITHHEPEHKDDVLRWTRTHQRMAIGWGKIGNLAAANHMSWETVRDAIKERYGLPNAPAGGHSLWDFYHSMQERDLVILSTGGRRKAVMRVAGPYEFAPANRIPPFNGNYHHQRAGELLEGVDPNELWDDAGGDVADGYSVRWTLVLCRRKLPAKYLRL